MADKKERKHRKNSVAGLVTRRVSLILIAALVVLLSLAYVVVSTIILRNTEWASEKIVTMYADVVKSESETAGAPITPEYPEISLTYGDFMCKWFDIDYAFVLSPNPEEKEFTYVSISYKDPEKESDFPDHYIGHVTHAEYSQEEIDLWLGKIQFSHIVKNSFYGHELITETIIEDSYGNRVSVGVDVDNNALYREINGYFLIIGLALLLVIAAVNIGMYLVIRRQVSEPAQTISSAMQNYVAGGKRKPLIVSPKGCNEFNMISSSFNSMTDNIDKYLKDIGSLTREQERQHTELNIAADIQKGFLPVNHIDSARYEVRAVMTPAKDVGGDLYDYVQLDDHRVLTVIADVSGKGVSAAMFMAVTLILIRQYAKMGLNPSEILCKTNGSLSENNAALLFASAFVGIYDSDTKIFTYSNAGHNPPYVIGNGVSQLKGASGTVLGLYEDEKYTDASVGLKTGDTIFLYTDGVNESINGDRRFYGEERLQNALVDFKKSNAEDLVMYMKDSIGDFTGEAEQHDDITMLTLLVKDTTELLLDYDVNEMAKIKETLLVLSLPRKFLLDLCLAAEECFINICSYAFEGGAPAGEKIKFTLTLSDRISIRFEDGGQKFNPLENTEIPDDYDIDTQMGGFGRFIAFSIVDDMKYEYTNGKNILTLTKYLREENK